MCPISPKHQRYILQFVGYTCNLEPSLDMGCPTDHMGYKVGAQRHSCRYDHPCQVPTFNRIKENSNGGFRSGFSRWVCKHLGAKKYSLYMMRFSGSRNRKDGHHGHLWRTIYLWILQTYILYEHNSHVPRFFKSSLSLCSTNHFARNHLNYEEPWKGPSYWD